MNKKEIALQVCSVITDLIPLMLGGCIAVILCEFQSKAGFEPFESLVIISMASVILFLGLLSTFVKAKK